MVDRQRASTHHAQAMTGRDRPHSGSNQKGRHTRSREPRRVASRISTLTLPTAGRRPGQARRIRCRRHQPVQRLVPRQATGGGNILGRHLPAPSWLLSDRRVAPQVRAALPHLPRAGKDEVLFPDGQDLIGGRRFRLAYRRGGRVERGTRVGRSVAVGRLLGNALELTDGAGLSEDGLPISPGTTVSDPTMPNWRWPATPQ